MSGTPVTRAEQKRLTRAGIVAAGRELFHRDGYTATGAEALARAAGISRATFYLHFRSKAEVVIELMRAREPEITDAYVALDRMTTPEHADVVAWLEEHATLWRRYGSEFAAMEQALAHESAVADEWYAMHRRTQAALENLTAPAATEADRAVLEAHLMTFMMALDRSFYFLLLRAHDENYHTVLGVLADQWLALLARPERGGR